MSKKVKIHANIDSLEPEAMRQFDNCCSNDFVLEAALMPDAHTGYVAPIGSVIKTKGVIVPAWVGYDIGCGMIAIDISCHGEFYDIVKEKSIELFDEVNKKIPMGVGRHNNIDEFSEIPYIYNIYEEILVLLEKTKDMELFDEITLLSQKNLGTLGSGNHFIEILRCWSDIKNFYEVWLVIHSGSRGVGHYVGTHFMKIASGKDKKFEETYAITNPRIKQEYLAYHDYCLKFSLLNRLSMAKKIEKSIEDITGINIRAEDNLWCNKNHNYCIEIEPNVYLHRKGATSSEINEIGVIPANMKDGCFLVRGLGNSDFLNSSSHGAGRALSRGEAKRKITLEDFKEAMNGIVAPVNKDTLDESPMAYKNIFEVMESQKGSVEVIKHLKPIINWKGY